MRSRPDVTTTSPAATSVISGTYFMTRSVATAPSTPTWPETIPVARLRSIITPAPLWLSRRS